MQTTPNLGKWMQMSFERPTIPSLAKKVATDALICNKVFSRPVSVYGMARYGHMYIGF